MSRAKFREEMIQVAAVAVAILEDMDQGKAHHNHYWNNSTGRSILGEISAERSRQDRKWGPQHHSPEVWMAILMEEVGEAADELTPLVHENLDVRMTVARIGSLGAAAKALLDAVVFPK